MGFLSNLFGMTGPGRLGAALNALTAKYMLDQMEYEHQAYMREQIIEALMQGSGKSYEYAVAWVDKLETTAYYGLATQIFIRMDLPPAFPKCFPGGRWNIIDNPIIGLHSGNNEIEMAQREILQKYTIQIHLSSKQVQTAVVKKQPHEVIISDMHNHILAWAHNIFKPIKPHVEHRFRHEYLVAFSATIAIECYLFAMSQIKKQEPNTNCVVNFIQGISDYLNEKDCVNDASSFLQNMMIEYRDMFNKGLTNQNMYELCSDFSRHYTTMDGLEGQINQLSNTIKQQCTDTSRSASELL